MNHIFISYSRRDEKIVDYFVHKMRNAGYSVWLDKSGAASGIPFSTKWMDVIVEALYTAQGAIIFHSPAWEASEPCKKEFEIIQKCDMPYIELDPAEAAQNTNAVLARVRRFYDTELSNRDNLTRTALFSNSYAYKSGVDPYQLLSYSRAAEIGKILKYLLFDMRRYTGLVSERKYEHLNPDIYPAMQAYLKFAKKAATRSLAAVSIGAVFALVMLIFVLTYEEAIPIAIEDTQAICDDMAYAGDIERFASVDLARAISLAEDFSAEEMDSAFTLLNHNTLRLERRPLPDSVVLNAAEADIARYGLDQESRTSDRYTAKISDTGTLIITDKKTGVSDSVIIPAAADGYAWNEAGDKIVVWCGSRVFVYHPEGGGLPVELEENYQKIKNAAIVDVKAGADEETDAATGAGTGFATVVAALSESGSMLVWHDPIADQVNDRTDITFARFLATGKQAAAVYISNNKIIVNENNEERQLAANLAGEIISEGFAVSHDSSRIAVVHSDGSRRVGIVELNDSKGGSSGGNVVLDVETPIEPNCLAFSKDDRYVFAAGRGCALIRIDTMTGEVACSDDTYYMHNLALYGDKLIVTDYYGNAIIYDQELQPQSDFGIACQLGVPLLDLRVAENKGFLFTVNRGGGETTGCGRYVLSDGQVFSYIVDKTDKVAANTAVAVSPDEQFVAYGYPDGTIRVYESYNTYLAGEYQTIGEAVSALEFGEESSSANGTSADGSQSRTIYALGRSGTIYTLDIATPTTNDSLEIMQTNWKNLQSRLQEKRQKYEDGIEE